MGVKWNTVLSHLKKNTVKENLPVLKCTGICTLDRFCFKQKKVWSNTKLLCKHTNIVLSLPLNSNIWLYVSINIFIQQLVQHFDRATELERWYLLYKRCNGLLLCPSSVNLCTAWLTLSLMMDAKKWHGTLTQITVFWEIPPCFLHCCF